MAMEKTGAPQHPEWQKGVANVPFPNGAKVMVYKGEQGFVPQPTVTNEVCGVDGCVGVIMIWPDNKRQCQTCLRGPIP